MYNVRTVTSDFIWYARGQARKAPGDLSMYDDWKDVSGVRRKKLLSDKPRAEDPQAPDLDRVFDMLLNSKHRYTRSLRPNPMLERCHHVEHLVSHLDNPFSVQRPFHL